MDVAGIVLAVILGAAFTALPFLFRAGGEGRLRRGAGWYLNLSEEPLDRGMRERERQQALGPPRTEGASPRAIRWWSIGGLGDVALAILLGTVFGLPILAGLVGVVGLALLGMAGEAWRANRYRAGDARIRAQELLEGAERAEAQARRLLAGGERVKARELLLRAADDLRTYAPGSGDPEAILARSRELRASAEQL
jgi:hypothetical protein